MENLWFKGILKYKLKLIMRVRILRLKLKRVIFILFYLCFERTQCSWAMMQDINALSGADQTFTIEHRYESFAENFHRSEILAESPLVDETKKQPLDSWRYTRDFKVNAFHSDNHSTSLHDPKPETVFTYSPAVGLSHRRQNVFISMFYNLSYADFVQNQKSSRLNKSQKTELRFNFNRLTVTLNNLFKPDSAFVQGERTELRTTDGKHVITYFNSMQLNALYKVSPKTEFSFLYGDELFYFPNTKNINTNNQSQSTLTQTFSPKLSYRLTPKTKVFADYTFGIVNYFKGGTFGSRENSAHVGVGGKIFSDVGVNLSAGYSYVEYLKSVSPALKGFNFNLGVSKKIFPKVRASLSTTHEIGQNFDSALFESNALNKDFYGLILSWRAAPQITVDAEGTVGLSSRQGLITLTDPDNPTMTFTRPREEDTYRWGLRLRWAPRPFFDLLLAYEYINRNSSFKDFEYDAHQLAGSLNYKF